MPLVNRNVFTYPVTKGIQNIFSALELARVADTNGYCLGSKFPPQPRSTAIETQFFISAAFQS